jgi:hypothetical protein
MLLRRLSMNGSKRLGSPDRPEIPDTSIKYFGIYRGTVADNDDPKRFSRIKASVPDVLGVQLSGWALPCMPYGGLPEQGMYAIPDIGAHVWVQFEAGDIDRPIWVGTYWEKYKAPEPTTRMIKTQSGHTLLFHDEEDNQRIRLIHSSGAAIWIDRNGSIALKDDSGAKFKLNAYKEEITLEDASGNIMTLNDRGTKIECSNGNEIEMSATGITLDAPKIVLKCGQLHLGGEGGEPVIKGQSFLGMFATHTHTVAPVVGGPTSPPIPQGEMSTLSTTVKSI